MTCLYCLQYFKVINSVILGFQPQYGLSRVWATVVKNKVVCDPYSRPWFWCPQQDSCREGSALCLLSPSCGFLICNTGSYTSHCFGWLIVEHEFCVRRGIETKPSAALKVLQCCFFCYNYYVTEQHKLLQFVLYKYNLIKWFTIKSEPKAISKSVVETNVNFRWILESKAAGSVI